MQEEFIIKIRATYNQMTKAEKKVADYILRDPRGMLFLSITELAEAFRLKPRPSTTGTRTALGWPGRPKNKSLYSSEWAAQALSSTLSYKLTCSSPCPAR